MNSHPDVSNSKISAKNGSRALKTSNITSNSVQHTKKGILSANLHYCSSQKHFTLEELRMKSCLFHISHSDFCSRSRGNGQNSFSELKWPSSYPWSQATECNKMQYMTQTFIYLLLIFRLMGMAWILSWSSKSKCLFCLIWKEWCCGMLSDWFT